jgi:HEAT repeat protein
MVGAENALLATVWLACTIITITTGPRTMAADPKLTGEAAAQVTKAFDAVRGGDLSQLSGLEKLGPPLVPALAAYVSDADESVRREAVALLSVVAGDAAIGLLAIAMNDSSPEVAERAASALYDRFDPERVLANGDAAKSIIANIAKGQPAAATLLLAGYLPVESATPALEKFLERPGSDYQAALSAGASPVTARLPARLALARLGDKAAMHDVAILTERASVDEWQFLFAAIRDINAPRMLHAIKRALDDMRETSAGIPSHADPKRRVCDEAASALATRLNLKTSFPLTAVQRYTLEQLAEVRRLIDETIPQ